MLLGSVAGADWRSSVNFPRTDRLGSDWGPPGEKTAHNGSTRGRLVIYFSWPGGQNGNLGTAPFTRFEILYILMGPGCREVPRFPSGDAAERSDVIVGRWKDGRIGAVRTLRPSGAYAVVFRPTQIVRSKVPQSYAPLVKQSIAFFETGKPPVSNE